MTTYFGFALANSMFFGSCDIRREVLDVEDSGVKKEVEAASNCCNPTHQATIDAANSRFGLELQIPAKPPSIKLAPGDAVIVMGVLGLPRLEGRSEYTQAEIDSAKFEFVKYTVK